MSLAHPWGRRASWVYDTGRSVERGEDENEDEDEEEGGGERLWASLRAARHDRCSWSTNVIKSPTSMGIRLASSLSPVPSPVPSPFPSPFPFSVRV